MRQCVNRGPLGFCNGKAGRGLPRLFGRRSRLPEHICSESALVAFPVPNPSRTWRGSVQGTPWGVRPILSSVVRELGRWPVRISEFGRGFARRDRTRVLAPAWSWPDPNQPTWAQTAPLEGDRRTPHRLRQLDRVPPDAIDRRLDLPPLQVGIGEPGLVSPVARREGEAIGQPLKTPSDLECALAGHWATSE